MQYHIISDSSCDLPHALTKVNQIEVVPFYVSFDGATYKREHVELQVCDFYQQMIDQPKVYPKSSLPSVQDYLDVFTPHVKNKIPIICICITIKFSGSYNSAINAREILLETYPDAKIAVIDSTVNTVLQGLFVLEAVHMREDGFSFEDSIEMLEHLKLSGRIIFTIGNLEYLKAGGRIGKLKGLAADTLGIKPLILLKEGEIHQNGLSRNRKKSKQKLISQFHDYFRELGDSPEHYQFSIGYGYDSEEAIVFRNELIASLKYALSPDSIPLYQIGATIAVHTGPHPLGIGLVRRYDAPAPALACEPLRFLDRLQTILQRTRSQVSYATEQALNQAGQAKEQVAQVTEQAKEQLVQATEQAKEQLASSLAKPVVR